MKNQKAELVEPRRPRRRRPTEIGPAEFAAALETGNRSPGRSILHRRVHRPCRLDLLRRQTARVARAPALDCYGVEPALGRIFEQAIPRAILCIARLEDR